MAGTDQHLRHEWSIAGVSHCHIHRCLLSSECTQCAAEFRPIMKCKDNRVLIYCSRCLWAFGRKLKPFDPDAWHPSQISGDADVMLLEQGVLGSLRTDWRSEISFSLIEDLAFLLSRSHLPGLGAKRYKCGLQNWHNHQSGRHTKLTKALASRWVHDGSQIFPLATAVVEHRFRLMATIVELLNNNKMDVPSVFDSNPILTVLEHLFNFLEHEGREEMVARANDWPHYLIVRLQKIAKKPRSTHPNSPYDRRVGWIESSSRLAINRGTLPKYAYF